MATIGYYLKFVLSPATDQLGVHLEQVLWTKDKPYSPDGQVSRRMSILFV